MEEIAHAVIRKRVTKYGNSAHIGMARKYIGDEVIVLLLDRHLNIVIRSEKRTIDSKDYVKAEIVDEAGNHTVWIPLKKADDMKRTQ